MLLMVIKYAVKEKEKVKRVMSWAEQHRVWKFIFSVMRELEHQ